MLLHDVFSYLVWGIDFELILYGWCFRGNGKVLSCPWQKNLQDLPKKCNLDVGLGPTNKEQKEGFCKVQKFMILED